MAGGAAIPISDIRGVDSLNYSKGEKIHRGKTASLYRVAELLGWSGSSKSLITVSIQNLNGLTNWTSTKDIPFGESTYAMWAQIDI